MLVIGEPTGPAGGTKAERATRERRRPFEPAPGNAGEGSPWRKPPGFSPPNTPEALPRPGAKTFPARLGPVTLKPTVAYDRHERLV
jgi:hypothetical protein